MAIRYDYPVKDPNGFFQIIQRELAKRQGTVEWFEITDFTEYEDDDDTFTVISVHYKTKRSKYERDTNIHIHKGELARMGQTWLRYMTPWDLTRELKRR